MKRHVLVPAALLALLASGTAFAAKKPAKKAAEPARAAEAPVVETAQVLRETALKKQPFTDAETAATLAANTSVTILQRQGAWVLVQAGSDSGWLRLLALRTAAVPTAGGESGLTQAINLARSGSSGNTVATGVRGLSKEQITNATPNPAEVAKLDGFAADAATAQAFAQQPPPLAEANVDYVQKGDGK